MLGDSAALVIGEVGASISFFSPFNVLVNRADVAPKRFAKRRVIFQKDKATFGSVHDGLCFAGHVVHKRDVFR